MRSLVFGALVEGIYGSGLICLFSERVSESSSFVGSLISHVDRVVFDDPNELKACMYTVFHSSNASLYIDSLRAGTHPIVPETYVDLHLELVSYWLDRFAWKCSVVDRQLISQLRGWRYQSENMHERHLSLSNSRNIIRFGLPHGARVTAPVRILASVLSRPESCDLRQTIRETWGRELSRGGLLRLYFFIGRSNSKKCGIEADVIELDMDDFYLNIATKVRLVLSYVNEHMRTDYDFLLRLDDDLYVRSDAVIGSLARQTLGADYWGSFSHRSEPIRDPNDMKHYISYAQYPNEDTFFPPYARGFAYGLSTELVSWLVQHIPTNTTIPFDDVMIGYTISQYAPHVNIDDLNEECFARLPICSNEFESTISPATWIVHHVNETQIRCMYAHDQASSDICACVYSRKCFFVTVISHNYSLLLYANNYINFCPFENTFDYVLDFGPLESIESTPDARHAKSSDS